MQEDIALNIFNAIKEDDIKSFEMHIKSDAALTLSFGRFPILTLCYLYNSKKIISKYEDRLLSISSYTRVEENIEMYTLFKQKAGRILRIYAGKDNIIHPLEMLSILNQAARLESVYSKANKTNAQIENIKLIEQIKQSKEVEATETKIKMPRQPLDRKVIKLAISFMAIFLCLALVFTGLGIYINTLGNGSAEKPYKVVSYTQLKQVVNENANIIIDRDFEAESLSFENYSGTIDGNGKTITLTNQDGSIFKEIIGNIKNLNFKINVDVTTNTEFGLLSSSLSGNLENVNIEVSGRIKIDGVANGMVNVSIYTLENGGNIKNANLSGSIDIVGDGSRDVCYGGIAYRNLSNIENVTVDCSSNLQSAHGANVCYWNQGTILNVINNGNISLYSNAQGTSLLLAAIVMDNRGTIKDSINNGDVGITITQEYDVYGNARRTYIGGIVCINYYMIDHCKNSGDITCNAKYTYSKLGGISAIGEQNSSSAIPEFKNCASTGNISISVENNQSIVFIGGIMGGYDYGGYMNFENCYSVCDAHVEGDYQMALIGGIGGLLTGNTYMTNNAYLFTDNVPHGIYVRYDYIFETRYEAYDSGEGMFAGYTQRSDIENLEIYW